MAACDCPTCERKRGNASSVHSGVIHSYASVPRNGWQPRRTPAEIAEGSAAPTFGVELETAITRPGRIADLPGAPARPEPYAFADRYQDPGFIAAAAVYQTAYSEWHLRNVEHARREQDRITAEGNLTADEAVSVASPRGLWHAKHDGSVSGPEFASQPATLAYWRSQRSALSSMCKALLHGGVRSHDGDTCGLHVNVGTDAFGGDAEHLYRFATLMVSNPRWTTRMAQRTHQSVQSWARFTPLADSTIRRRWAIEVMANGYAYQDRYSVLNAQNAGRIEVRVPRGTLRVDRFYAKLEWVASLIEYTRDASRPVRISDYMRWAVAEGTYPELARFFAERFPRRLERSVAAVAA